MKKAAAFCAAFCLLATSAGAEVYKWKDSAGVTHFSDTVPEQNKAGAKTVDVKRAELTESQRQNAEVQRRNAEARRQAAEARDAKAREAQKAPPKKEP